MSELREEAIRRGHEWLKKNAEAVERLAAIHWDHTLALALYIEAFEAGRSEKGDPPQGMNGGPIGGLRATIAEQAQRLAAVLAFYQELYDMADDGGDVDGGSLQDLGVKHGLLEEVEVTEPCGKACTCEEYDNIPGTCYRQADWVRAAAEGEGTK